VSFVLKKGQVPAPGAQLNTLKTLSLALCRLSVPTWIRNEKSGGVGQRTIPETRYKGVRGKRFSIHLPTRILLVEKGIPIKAMEVQSNENAALLKLLKTKSRTKAVKFQQRYQNSHRIFRDLLCSKNLRQFCGSQNRLLFSRPILGALYLPYPATGPPKSRALPESVTAQILSLEAVEQAYQEAVHGVSV
jgi:hypothetical protein